MITTKLILVSVNVLIFLLPFGVLPGVNLLNGVNVYFIDVLTCVLFVLLLLKFFKNKYLLRNKLFNSVLLFVVSAFFSLLLNISNLALREFFVSLLYLLRFLAYSSLLILPLLLTEKFRQSIPLKIFVSGLFFTFFGYIQYFVYPNLRNLFYLGWDDHLYRFFGTTLDPNFAGAILVITFLLGMGHLFKENISKEKKSFYVASLVFIIPAIFLTYLRSSLIMFGVSIVVFLIILKKVKWLILVFCVFVLGIVFIPKNLGGEGVNLLRTASIEARFESYSRAIHLFGSSPIYGVGFNAYRYAQIDAGFEIVNQEKNHAGAGVSNSWLFVLATTGMIGFVLFINFWFQVIKSIYKSKSNPVACSVISIIAGLFVHAMFENSVFYIFIMASVFLMIASFLSTPKKNKDL
mgnify:CR=1 FL=1